VEADAAAKSEARKIDAELQMKRMDADLKIAEIQAARPLPEAVPVAQNNNHGHHRHFDILKYMSKYQDSDDFEEFLHSFERTMTTQKIAKDEWTSSLGPVLNQKCMTVFHTIPVEDSMNYEKHKAALLKKFEVNAEKSRQLFRSYRRKDSQSYVDAANESSRLATSWLKKKDNAHLDLKKQYEAFTIEHFMNTIVLNQRLTDHILNAKLPTLEQIAQECDVYVLTHQFHRTDDNVGSRTPPKKPSNQLSNGAKKPPPPEKSNPSSAVPVTPRDRQRSAVTCGYCKYRGHDTSTCHIKERDERRKPASVSCVRAAEPKVDSFAKHMRDVVVNGHRVKGLNDNGSDLTIVKTAYVEPHQYNGRSISFLRPMDKTASFAPLAIIQFAIGDNPPSPTEVAVAEDLPFEVIIGHNETDKAESEEVSTVCAITRAHTRKNPEPQSPVIAEFEECIPLATVTHDQLARLQREDSTLAECFKAATDNTTLGPATYAVEENILHRHWKSQKLSKVNDTDVIKQIVVPSRYRRDLLELAHDRAGHYAAQKVKQRLLRHFYWPNIFKEIEFYCDSCDNCQRASKGRDRTKAPLQHMPVIAEVFAHVEIDIAGPLPKTSRDMRYVLCLTDYASRYPDAVALPDQKTDTVAEALMTIFARIGFPKLVSHDQGTNFTSNLLTELLKRCGIRQNVSTPAHPQSQGVVERQNRTIKNQIRAHAEKDRENWDLLLPYILFAIRDTVNRTTGFTPFEVVYPFQVRGPLAILKDAWTDTTSEGKLIAQYVLEVRRRHEIVMEEVLNAHEHAQETQKNWYDRRARARQYVEGQQVLVLNMQRKNKLESIWTGPYPILKRVNDVNYVVELTPNKHVTYHVNLFKPYVKRKEAVVCQINAVIEEDCDPLPPPLAVQDDAQLLADLILKSDLSDSQKSDISSLFAEFPQVFSSKPGHTTMVEHDIQLTDAEPIKRNAYHANPRIKEIIKSEIDNSLKLGLIKQVSGPYSSPIIIVERPGHAPRACVDYRDLNDKTVPDQYSMKNADELIQKVSRATFCTVFDLARGFHQLSLTPRAKVYSGFSTPFGNYQWERMPFGLRNSPATFQKFMDKLLQGAEEYAESFVDDLATCTQTTWSDHLIHLRNVLTRLAKANCTVKPDKIQLATGRLIYLGHEVRPGCILPESRKVEILQNYPTPKTKTDLRAYLGLAGYYSKFIPRYADMTSKLTDKLKKKLPDVLDWTPEDEGNFRKINEHLATYPVLRPPDYSKPFQVHSDSSGFALGAILSQTDDAGEEHPICYISRKLTVREQAMSTVEREALGLIYSINKFKPYLFGNEFLIISDHNPLTYLQRFRNENPRLLRYSLFLQPYACRIVHRAGRKHLNADGLSRIRHPDVPEDCDQE